MGLSYGLSFPIHDHMFHEQRLIFQALSRPGAGKTILTGCGDEDLRLKAELAGHWARVNRDTIIDDLQGPPGSGATILGKNRDLHLHVLHYVEGTPATVARFYTAAMGVAIASLLARRLPQRHVAVLGDVTTHDLFVSSTTPMVTRGVDVESLYAQGFRQLVGLVLEELGCMSKPIQSAIRNCRSRRCPFPGFLGPSGLDNNVHPHACVGWCVPSGPAGPREGGIRVYVEAHCHSKRNS